MLKMVNCIFVLFINCFNLPVPQLSKTSIMSNQALFGSLRKVSKLYFKYSTVMTKPQIVLADKSEGWNFHMKSKPRNTDFVLVRKLIFLSNLVQQFLSSSLILDITSWQFIQDCSWSSSGEIVVFLKNNIHSWIIINYHA